MNGVPLPLPPDEERCRRRGTPNWRCPQRALPGKSHCLKHYLFYVSRRHRLKTAGERVSDQCAGASSSVEPYRPVIDFDFHHSPVQTPGPVVNYQATLVDGETMGRFGGVGFGNGEIALGGGPACGRNDHIALRGEMGESQPFDAFQVPILEGNRKKCGGHGFDEVGLIGRFESFMNFDGVEFQKRKRGRPVGSKNKKKGVESGDKKAENVGVINHDDEDDDDDEVGRKRRQNLSWVMRDRQWSDSDSEEDDEGFDDQWASLDDKEDEGLPTIGTGGNGRIMLNIKKRGRPKGSKNKPKICSNGGEVYDKGLKSGRTANARV